MGAMKAMKALLGTKIGMTQIISEDGRAVPVTLIQAGPVTVTQVKTVETDGQSISEVYSGISCR
jgi:large subunit ribosomal protein L3